MADNEQTKTAPPGSPALAGSRARCEHCGQRRVPQYDEELRLAGLALTEWMRLADQMHRALCVSRRENQVKYAQNAYENLRLKYGRSYERATHPNSEVSGAGATASNDNNQSATRQRSLD